MMNHDGSWSWMIMDHDHDGLKVHDHKMGYPVLIDPRTRKSRKHQSFGIKPLCVFTGFGQKGGPKMIKKGSILIKMGVLGGHVSSHIYGKTSKKASKMVKNGSKTGKKTKKVVNPDSEDSGDLSLFYQKKWSKSGQKGPFSVQFLTLDFSSFWLSNFLPFFTFSEMSLFWNHPFWGTP